MLRTVLNHGHLYEDNGNIQVVKELRDTRRNIWENHIISLQQIKFNFKKQKYSNTQWDLQTPHHAIDIKVVSFYK